jgi:hypothetical protein
MPLLLLPVDGDFHAAEDLFIIDQSGVRGQKDVNRQNSIMTRLGQRSTNK